ncbi:hypothetical protein MBLNU457_g0725t1 [Dothideomycetes sp. NU457]
MPKAEVGSTKWLANNMKSKGLQRLRWYCQVCQRQMRDENGFKQHTMSEGHVRAMLEVGQDPRKVINEYSTQFKSDFLRLLRTAHGEKKVHANNFYQEYISDKNHVHMNSTKWPSLMEFVKYLGREGICRVEEGERGLEIAWVDDSPEALRRRDAVAKKERMEKGEEERQAKQLEQQIKRAREQKAEKEAAGQDSEDSKVKTTFERTEAQPIGFSLSAKAPAESEVKPSLSPAAGASQATTIGGEDKPADSAQSTDTAPKEQPVAAPTAPAKAMSLSLGGTAKAKPTNVFSSKNNPLKQKASVMAEQPKKMSKLEEIMMRDKEEQARKRQRQGSDGGAKRQRLGGLYES